MEYTFIIQDDGLFVVASCFDGEIGLAEGPTTVGRITSKGIITEVHKGSLIGREFHHDDRYYRASS